MIYVGIEGRKSNGCVAGGNGWHDTELVSEAIEAELARFHAMWDVLGHGAVTTYRIAVAPEASPRRTKSDLHWPLPVDVTP